MNFNEQPTDKIFVTKNSEYKVHEHRVVGVRRRGDKSWDDSHRAIGMLVLSDLGEVQVGDALRLIQGNDTMTTSRVVGVKRGPMTSQAA